MKKKVIFILIFYLIVTVCIFSQVKHYEFELLASYKQSFIYNAYETFGLITLNYNKDQILSYNSNNHNIVYFNKDFSIKKVEQLSENIYIPLSNWKIFSSNDFLFFEGDYIDSSIVKSVNNVVKESYSLNTESFSCIFMKDNFVILEDENNYSGIIISEVFEKDLKFMNQDETFLYIKENWSDKDKFWVDKDQYIFYGERLITGDADRYIEYFEIDKQFVWTLINVDINNNYYWGGSGRILVFDKSGKLMIEIITDPKYGKSPPSIDPSGNIYYFHYNEETNYTDLYRILNDWDPITFGIVNDKQVRIRENPTLEGTHLGYLEKDEKVQILEKTSEKMEIGDMNDYWYQIKRTDGTEGWAYGFFIDEEE